MITFKQFLSQNISEEDRHVSIKQRLLEMLSEGNPLARVQKHVKNDRHFVTISGERSNLSPAENKARHKQIQQKVRQAGYGFRKTKGKWQGGGENSVLVTAKKDGPTHGNRLKKDMRKISQEFNQDAFMHHGGKDSDSAAHFHGTTKGAWPGKNKKMRVGKVRFNRRADNETETKGGGTFTATDAKVTPPKKGNFKW